MKMRWTLRLILVVLVVQAVGLMSAQATDYRWDKATDGNWNDTSAWTPTGSFPNNGNDTARVGTTTPGVTVFANDDFMVSQITLVEGTGLTVNDGKSLHLYNSSGLAPIYAGTLTLNGTSAPTSLFADGADVGFARRIKIILAGSGNNYFQGSGKFILEAYSFLEGRGYIQSNFDNRGTITGETLEFGAIALNNSGSMSGSFHLNGTVITNSGTMSELSLSSLGSQIDNSGSMTGSVSLKGAQLKNTGNMSGSVSLTDIQVVNSGNMNGSLSLTDTQVVNSGKMAGNVFLNGAQVDNNGIIYGWPSFTLKDTQVSGTGSLIGYSVKLENATLIDHKITGFAEVKSNSEFKGFFSGNVTVANGQKLSLSPSVNASKLSGEITLFGTSEATTLYANGATATLQGRTVLGGTGNNFLQGTGFVNYGTIEGKGYIQAPVENYGSIVATDGILDVQSAITGDGKVGVSGTLKIGQNLQAGSLSMNSPGKLLVADDVTIDLKGNFSFRQLETSRWGWGSNTTLMLSGHGNVIEVGGNDFSYDLDGFSNNFNLVNLSINGTFANLLDEIDNGHRGGLVGAVDEALYVDSLYIGEGATLNLNGLHLYVKDYGLVTATDDWFNGDGRVINYDGIVPLPPTLLLVGFGLLGLAGLRIKASRG